MATRKKHLINVHTSTGTTAPTGASLYLGEIAVQHTPNDPGLWIKMGTSESSDVYEKFIGSTEITNMFEDTKILGSGYTYSGIPYVNSSTTLADAYSALTREMIDDEKVVAAALNDLNGRVIEISGNTPDMTNYYDKGEVEHIISVSGGTDVSPLSGAVVSLSAGTIALVGSSAASVFSSAKTYTDSEIGKLDSTGHTSDSGHYLTSVTITDGKITAVGEEPVPGETDITTATSGNGNVISNLTVTGHQITMVKGITAATSAQVSTLSAATTGIGQGLSNLSAATLSAVTAKGDNYIDASVASRSAITVTTKKPVVTDLSAAISTTGSLADAKAIKTYIDNTLSSTVTYKGATDSLPSNPAAGDMWVAASAFTAGGQSVEVGDFVIARTSGTSAQWDVIEKNLDGAVTGNLTADTVTLGESTNSVKSLANGSNGTVLAISGNKPVWTSAVKVSSASVADNALKVNSHTVATDVPAGAVFTDTATTEGGHYTPGTSASTEGSATGFIRQIRLDSKKHVVGIVSGSVSDTATTETGHYTPSTSASTKGTTAATTTSFIKGIRVDSKSHVIDVVTGAVVTAETQMSYNSGSSVSNNASAVMTGLTVSNHAITYGKTNKIFSASTSDSATTAGSAVSATTSQSASTAAALTGNITTGQVTNLTTKIQTTKVNSATTADSAANATHAAAATKVDSALTINILNTTGGTASTVTFNGSANKTVNVPANTDTATTETGHYTPGTSASTEGSATGFIRQIRLDSKKHVVGIVSGTTSYTETAVTTKNGTTGSTAAPVLSSITTGGTRGHELTLNYTNKVNSATTANSAVTATNAVSATTSLSAKSADDSAKLGGVAAANYSQTSHTHSNYATTTNLNALSAATTVHTADTAVHVTAAQKTNWTNSGTSGANAYVGFIAHSANTGIHVTDAQKTAWNAKADISDLAGFFDGAVYDSGSRRINFKHGDTVKAWIDADPFIKDGMLSSVTISGGKMIMTFNTEAGHDDIELNLTDIFNADNYYDKTASDSMFVAKEAGMGLMSDAERSKLSGISAGAEVNVQADWNVTATTSDAYIRNKPFIPSKVSDLNNDLNFTSNIGTVTGVRMNGGDKTPTNGIVNLGTVITAETQLSVATAGTGNAVTGITVGGHGITAALGGPFATAGAVNDVAADLAAHTADTQVHVTDAQKAAWDAKKSNVRADWSETATTSDAYILNKPSIPDAPGTLTTTATTPLASAVTESLTGNVSLHKIAKTGSYNDLNNKPTIPTVPANISAFNNDAGYITGYTESDPTVPAWAKAATKPAYTASEVGALPAGTTLDGVPDGATRKLSNYSLTSHTHSNYATTTNLNALSGGTVSRINSLSGAAVNNQNRINSLSGAAVSNKTGLEELSGAMMSKEYVISQAFNDVNDRILELSGSTGLPDVTAADNGKILRVQSGAWAMVDPTVIYTGSGTPASTLGNEGDIYFQI